MKAFIFNSGVGSRLGDLTKDRPKGLVELKSGETILGRQLRILKNAGIKEFIISTGYKEDSIKDFCLKEFPELKFKFVYNAIYDKTNSIYSMFLAHSQFNDEFLIMHGDLVFDQGIIDKLLSDKRPNLSCINTSIPKPPKDFKGRVIDGKLQEISVNIFGENDHALQPLYKLSRLVIEQWFVEMKKMIASDDTNVYAENALNKILPTNEVFVIDYSDSFLEEIDNLEDYERVCDAIRIFDFKNQKIYLGDYLVKLDEVLVKHKFTKPFIVHSRAAKKNPGYEAYVEKNNPVLFNGYSPNPKYEEVLAGLKLFNENNCDVIVAIGGGSCLDVAKAIKLFSKLDPNVNYLQQRPVYVNTPFIAIPTTAGTGSEATRYAVIYQNDVKQSLTHDSIFPNIVISDDTFLRDLPVYHRKAALLDAFCQAIEGFWAKKSNEISQKYSRKALQIFLHSYKHYLEGHPFVDNQIMRVAYFAGQSINVTATTAPHAMSYKLTSLTGIAHGHAVSLTLTSALKLMLEETNTNSELYTKLVDLAAIFNTSIDKLHSIVLSIFNEFEMEVPTITTGQLSELVSAVNPERLSNHPMELTEDDIRQIYRSSINIK